MNGKKKRLFLTSIIRVFLFFNIIFLNSCDLFNKSIPEYLEYYTSEVIPGEVTFSGNHYKNKYGIECIPSTDELYNINVSLINIKKVYFKLAYEINEGNVQTVSGFESFCNSSKIDDLNARIEFSKDALKIIDEGNCKNSNNETTRDISGKLVFYQKVGESDWRPFSMPLVLNISVNTKPEDILEACIQADGEPVTSGPDNRKMIICFKMKEMYGTVHEYDTHDLYIGNDHFKISYEGGTTNFTGDAENTGILYKSLLPDEVVLKPILPGGFNYNTNVDSGYFNIYYLMDDAVSGNTEKKYTIKVQDDDGLSSSSVVTPKSLRLNKPGIICSYDENKEKVIVNINHDRKVYNGVDTDGSYIWDKQLCNGNIEISYKVIDKDKNEVIKNMAVKKVSDQFELDTGINYEITAIAKCEEYIESENEVKSCYQKRSLNYFVDQKYQGESNGSKLNPYNQIEYCINNFISRTDLDDNSCCNIYLKDNIFYESGMNSPLIFSCNETVNAKKYLLDGQGYTVNLQNSTNGVEISQGAQLVLKNITITNGTFSNCPVIMNEGNLYLSNGTVITDNETAYGAIDNKRDGAQIYIEGNVVVNNNKVSAEGNSKNIVLGVNEKLICTDIHLDENTNQYMMNDSNIGFWLENFNSSSVITENFKYITNDCGDISIFKSDQGYAVSWAGIPASEVKVIDQCINLTPQDFEEIKVCTDTDVISSDYSDHSNRIIHACVTVNERRIVQPSDWSARIYKNGSPVNSVTFNTDKIVFDDDLKEDIYELQFKFSYENKKYTLYKTIKSVAPEFISTPDQFYQKLFVDDSKGHIFKLANDIDISANSDLPGIFNGILDGCGKTLTVSNCKSAGIVENNYGVIQNLKIVVNVTGAVTSYAGIACTNYGTIASCLTTGTISFETFGALAGICLNNNGLIENCINQINISSGKSGWMGFYGLYAGIAASNGTMEGGTGIIKNCVNYGNIYSAKVFESSSNGIPYSNGRVGSIVGTNNINGFIENCYWKENCASYYNGNTVVYLNTVGFYTGSNKFKSNYCLDELYGASGRITGCGYFTGLTITAGTSENCKVNQIVSDINLLNALNNYVVNSTGLSIWKKDSSNNVLLDF